jgi:hypothetical protein
MHSKRLLVVAAALVVGVALAALAPRRSPAGDPGSMIRFHWSFCAQVGSQEPPRTVPITRDMALHSGDRLKIFWQPVSACYLYVLHCSSQGKLSLLFPADLPGGDPPAAQEYFIPEGHRWFRLDDHPGPETFYVLASRNRLEPLENLIGRHLRMTSGADTAAATEAILSEIRRLRRENIRLAAPAERPVRLGGNLRSTEEQSRSHDIRPFAVEISAADIFARTFSIDHR